MASRKRKLQEDATYPNSISYGKAELDAMMDELILHISLRIAEAKRLNLPKVRFEMIDMVLAQALLDVLQTSRAAFREADDEVRR